MQGCLLTLMVISFAQGDLLGEFKHFVDNLYMTITLALCDRDMVYLLTDLLTVVCLQEPLYLLVMLNFTLIILKFEQLW